MNVCCYPSLLELLCVTYAVNIFEILIFVYISAFLRNSHLYSQDIGAKEARVENSVSALVQIEVEKYCSKQC